MPGASKKPELIGDEQTHRRLDRLVRDAARPMHDIDEHMLDAARNRGDLDSMSAVFRQPQAAYDAQRRQDPRP